MIKKIAFTLLGAIVLGLALLIALILTRKVEPGDTITLYYAITLEDGMVYYSNMDGKPLQETLGEGKLLPGFEEALIGLHLGQSKRVMIPSEEAYGQYNPDLVGTVTRDWLPEGVEPVVGRQLGVKLKDGTQTFALITEITESTVTLDANHPLAGENLTFDIQLLEIENHGLLGRLTNPTVLSWASLLLGGIILGFIVYNVRKRGSLLWMKASGKRMIYTAQKGLTSRSFSRPKLSWIFLLASGVLLIGFALMKQLIAEKVDAGETVRIDYTLRLEDGTVYNASTQGEPLQVTLGDGNLIPGFEEALIGMRVGESRTVKIPSEKAYGPYHPELILEFDRNQLPEGSQPVVGQQAQATTEEGKTISAVIKEVTESTITMDANYPLAGQNLTFDIKLVSIEKNRASTERAYLSWAIIGAVAIAFVILGFYLKQRRGLSAII